MHSGVSEIYISLSCSEKYSFFLIHVTYVNTVKVIAFVNIAKQQKSET